MTTTTTPACIGHRLTLDERRELMRFVWALKQAAFRNGSELMLPYDREQSAAADAAEQAAFQALLDYVYDRPPDR